MIFTALFNRLQTIDTLFPVSAGISRDKKEYVVVEKVSNVLDFRSTCLERLENSIYRVRVFTFNFPELRRQLGLIESALEFSSLTIANRRFVNLNLNDVHLEELEKGFYTGFLQFAIDTQKDFRNREPGFQLTTTSASNFWEALYLRYKNSTLLSDKIKDFVTTSFVQDKNKRPYIFIPKYNVVNNWWTTCTRLQETTFNISVEGYSPTEIELILEEVDNLYSYCKLGTSDKRFTNLEWIGDSLIQEELELWIGSITYQIILEKNIVTSS